jgi:DNA ligase (NAD+)
MTFDLNSAVKKYVEARQAYYVTGRTIMSDQEYDALEETIKQHDPTHPALNKIGHKPSPAWKSAGHSISMGSLRKVHSKEDFLKWAEKYPYNLTMQLKLDGLSLSIDYADSKFVRAITRGDGITGEEITPNVMLMRDFKETLDVPNFTGSIRAEILLDKEDFEKINSILTEYDQYSNARNAAAGISRRLDGMFCNYLHIVAYDLNEPIDEHEKLNRLQAMGLKTPMQIIGNRNEMVEAFETFKENRSTLPFDIDGVVVKVCSHGIQEQEGSIKNRPRAQIAFKFDPPGASTVLLDVLWEVGRTGVVVPVAVLEPVTIAGSVIQRATLHNVAQIKKLGLGIGDTIMVVKAGDIIPYVMGVIEHKDKPIEIPTICPGCGNILINDEIKLMCINDDCKKKAFYRILNWIKVVEIDSFGPSLAESLSTLNKLNSIADIYSLKKEDISTIEGWGGLSADTILDNINQTRKLTPVKFLSAIGMLGISESTSEELLKNFGSVETLFKITVEDLIKIKGFSDISARSIISELAKYRVEIEELMKTISVEEEKHGGKLAGLSFCFTGAMAKPRAQYQAMVINNGGKNFDTVKKDLSYLVCNEDKGSSKSQKAEKYSVKIITEEEFLKMVGEEIKTEKQIKSFSLFE